ncbi:MAG: chromosomal replication initiator DnaA [Alphaproteobacteria bacterium]|nr:MAG: chromosomal replication initiator DnaA [Alphaproteobacteria bacterium]
MARQLAFDLPLREARGRGDFFVSESNAQALAAIETWAAWPGRKLALVGPAGAGKSHLVAVWAGLAGARVLTADDLPGLDPAAFEGQNVALEDAEAIAGTPALEEAAFHLHNAVLNGGGALLVTARRAPARWPLALPDLASRMQGMPVVAITPPDEALLAAVLVKLFADRQIDPPESLIRYLVARIDRSFDAARAVVAALDAAALAEGRPLGIGLARDLLERADPAD